MRNGNFLGQKVNSLTMTGSYPTYEEWKPYILPFGYNAPPVLILPMRNGNPDRRQNEPGKIMVLILPMRNGNIKMSTQY